MRRLLFALCVVLLPAAVEAQTVRKVCASGTSGAGDDTYTLAQLQTALNDAVGGDTVLTQRGYEFVGSFSLPRHTGASYATFRTGVESDCSVTSVSVFPAANLRMTATRAASANLSTLRCNSNNCAALKTSDPSGGTAPEYWRVEWLKLASNTSTDMVGSGSMLTCGSDSGSVVTSYSEVPQNFVFSQLYLVGDAITGQFRGISLHCNNTTIQDSTVEHIKSMTEGQALWMNSFERTGTGVVITNNVFSGGTEVVMAGGSSGAAKPAITVLASPAPTTTTATLSGRDGLRVGKSVTFAVAGVEQQADIVSCGTSTENALCTSDAVTFTALTAAPDAPGDVDWGLNPGGVTFTKNLVTRPTSLRSAILGTPQSVTASSSTTGGTLGLAGTSATYSYKVVARLKIASSTSTNMAQSTASTEVTAMTTGNTATATVSWAPVTNATEYRVYGRQAGAQNIYWTVASGSCSATVCSYTDTGTSGTTGSVPTASGTQFYVKNVFELKNMDGMTVEGNIFEHSWFMTGGQYYAITLTPSNTGATNDSTRLRNITFRHNIVRHAPGGVSICGRDCSVTAGNGEATGRTSGITISNNLFYDINSSWGGSVNWLLISAGWDPGLYAAGQAIGPLDLTVEHNTIDHGNGSLINFDLYKGGAARPVENFTFRNNIGRKASYGLFGANSCAQGNGCWTTYTTGTSPYTQNVIADASCGSYPSGTLCPTSAALNADFTDLTARNYLLKSTSAYKNAGSDGTDLGAIHASITALTNIAESGTNTGGAIIVPPSIVTSALPSGQTDQTYGPVTLTGTCNEAPCTWAATGLPTGTALNSTTGVISQTGVLAAGTYTPAVTYTDAGARVASRTFAVTIAAVVAPAPEPGGTPGTTTTRPRYDYQDCGSISAADTPTQIRPGEGLIVCDTWFDQTTGVWKSVVATSPAVTWNPLGSATSVISLNAGGSSFTWTDQPQADTQLNGSTSSRVPFDATQYRSFRWTLRVQGASASANTPKCYVKYSTDDSTYTTLDGTDLSLASAVTLKTAWITLPAATQADVYWRIFCSGGDGAADPAFGTLTLQFRQY